MFEEQHYLTESGNRYKVNQYGKVLDSNSCELRLVIIAKSTDEENFFCSSKKAIEYFKYSKTLFFYRIKNNRLFNDKYLLSIFKLEKNLGLPIE